MRSEPLIHVDLAFVPSLPSTDNAELSRYMDLHGFLLLRVCFVVIIRVDPTCSDNFRLAHVHLTGV